MALRLIVVALLVVGSGSVFADEFTIANTGFLADGTTLGTPGTSLDGNWSLISCPGGCAGGPYVTDDGGYPFAGGPFVWLANDPGLDPNPPLSQWISPQATYDNPTTPVGDPDGLYTYRVSFDLEDLLPGTAYLSFRAAADNEIVDVLINGVSTGFSYLGFAAWSPNGEVTSGFVAGVNTLDFIVDNWDSPWNGGMIDTPSGLRVEFLSATADPEVVIPEPTTMGLMGFGLIALGVAYRRRKRLA